MVKQSEIDSLLPELENRIPKIIHQFNSDQNLFHITSMDHMEIKHSNVLAWLLDGNESHGLKDLFFKNLMLEIIFRHKNKLSNLISEISQNNWCDSIVLREYKNIDILFHDDTYNLNLIIENKIYSSEHSDQLNRYKKIIDFEYPSNRDTNVFVYLTLYGESPSSSSWLTLTYRNVITALNKTIHDAPNCNSAIRIILSDYVYLLKELTGMNNDEKQKIATEIWNKHKNAIEFIENNRFKPEKEILNEFQKLCNSENSIYNIQFDSKYCDITHIRFKTKGMNEFIRENEIDQKNGSWNSNQKYYYELVVVFKKNHMVFGQLSFKLCNCDTDDKLKISQIFRKKPDDDADWEVKKFHFKSMQQKFDNHIEEYNPDEVRQECKNVFTEYLSEIETFESPLPIEN